MASRTRTRTVLYKLISVLCVLISMLSIEHTN